MCIPFFNFSIFQSTDHYIRYSPVRQSVSIWAKVCDYNNDFKSTLYCSFKSFLILLYSNF